MWQFLKDNPFIVGALSGSLAAYLLGLLVAYLRREKRWLGYSIESRNIVKAGHSLVTMKYENRDIRRLDSHTVLLRNIGNRSFTNLPIRILASEGAQIVEHEVEPPDGATFHTHQSRPAEITITCDLLNPGEAAGVGVTVADSSDGELKVTARAEGLTVKRIAERSTTSELLSLLLEASSMTRAVLDVTTILMGGSGRRLTRR